SRQSKLLPPSCPARRRDPLNRWLIGFDVRLAKEQYVSEHWGTTSRAEYLLRPDIEWPLSVSRRVWPSVFYLKIFRDPTMDSYSTIEVELDVDEANRLDLEKLRAYYDAHRGLAPGAVFIGIELLSERDAEGPSIPYELPGASSVESGWTQPIPIAFPKAVFFLATMWP